MRATGIVRRIDDLGRVVIPKPIRSSLKIHDGDTLEIFLEDGGVMFKKYQVEESDLEDIAKEWLKENNYLYNNTVITRIGGTITAEVIKDNRRCIGTAKCHPEDDFSLYVGEAIALARAWDCQNILPSELKP